MGLGGWPFTGTGTQLLDLETNKGIEANGMIFLKTLKLEFFKFSLVGKGYVLVSI